jgi:hypothetical protein
MDGHAPKKMKLFGITIYAIIPAAASSLQEK